MLVVDESTWIFTPFEVLLMPWLMHANGTNPNIVCLQLYHRVNDVSHLLEWIQHYYDSTPMFQFQVMYMLCYVVG